MSSGDLGWAFRRGGSESVTSSALAVDWTTPRCQTARGLDGVLAVPDGGRLALALGLSVGLTGMLGKSASGMVRSRSMSNFSSSSSWDEPAVSSSSSSFLFPDLLYGPACLAVQVLYTG